MTATSLLLPWTAWLSASTADPTDAVDDAVPDSVQDSAQDSVEAMGPVLGIAVNVLVGVVAAVVLVLAVSLVLNLALRRQPELRKQIRICRVPATLALSLLATRVALGLTSRQEPWFDGTAFVLLIALVGAVAWLALRVVRVVEQRLLDRYQSSGVEDLRDRKIRTQTILIRRILNAVIIVIAVAVILLAIPSVRAVGAGLLASAGVLSVVAGLAVQSTLTNVFAGVQLAFTDAIRVGDVVDMEDTFGTIEEITLSSVVVKIWDGRRMVYPSSHFTTTPFENWTRTGSALSGTVEMDVDWEVPLDAMRERLRALLESTELWDGRECSMQVTDALGGPVRIRAVVSARSSGDLWDLRCLVREDFVKFLRADHPEGIYAQRMVEGTGSEAAPSAGLATGLPGLPEIGHRKPGEPRRSPEPGSLPRVPEDAVTWRSAERAETPRPAGEAADPTQAGPQTHTAPLTRVRDDSSVFTGSITAVERNREFSGPGEQAYQDRRERQEKVEGGEDTGRLRRLEETGRARPEHHHDDDA